MNDDERDRLTSLINEAAQQAAARRAEAEEDACVDMVLDPARRGVLIIEYGSSMDYVIQLDSTVPWGEIRVLRTAPRLHFHP